MRAILALLLLGILFCILRQAWVLRQAERAAFRARMIRPALLTDEELTAWQAIESGWQETAEGVDD